MTRVRPTIDAGVVQRLLEIPRAARCYATLQDSAWWNWFQGGYYVRFRLPSGELPPLLPAAGIRWVRDVPYVGDKGAGRLQSLDLFLPEQGPATTLSPVLVFIHGGGWRAGDKRQSIHVHANLCLALARRGVVAVNVNHRLSPAVRHPEHARDIACALRWVQQHIQQFGGSPDRVFVAGHSSGGHLAALVALDERYVVDAGLAHEGFIKGVVGISGVYDLGRFAENSFARRCMVYPAFGRDPSNWSGASPIQHIRRGAPPFLLFQAESEEAGVDCRRFMEQLREASVSVECHEMKSANHFTILSQVGQSGDLLAERVAAFVGERRSGRKTRR